MGGWLRLYRRTIRSEVFEDPYLLKVWVWALCRANYKRVWVSARTGRGKTRIEVQPGQFIFGRKTASAELRMPDGTVYGRMKKLQQIGCISMQPNTHFTIVTICNWNRYQRPQRKSPQATAHPSNTQPNTGEEESKRTNTLSRAKLRFDDGDMDLAKLIWGKVHELHPSRKAPNLDQWANEVRLLRERDGRTLEDARELFSLANADSSFWAANVMSPAALRKHWDQLDLKLRRRPAARPGSNGASRSPTRIHQRNINDYCS